MSEETSVQLSIADEFLRAYPRGSRLLAVSSRDGERSTGFADTLVEALRVREVAATAVTPNAPDADTLRSEVVGPFRTAREDAVLVVAGDESLLDSTRRGMWHFSVWLMAEGETPHTAATALVDVRDRQHPSRTYADFCAVPDGYLS